jgi:hypothetical protein
MLSSLLPGIRHLRSPLAAGYLWLAVIWVAGYPWEDATAGASSFARLMSDFGDVLSGLGAGVALSLAAYLIGGLSVGVLDPLLLKLTPIFMWIRDWLRRVPLALPGSAGGVRIVGDPVYLIGNTSWRSSGGSPMRRLHVRKDRLSPTGLLAIGLLVDEDVRRAQQAVVGHGVAATAIQQFGQMRDFWEGSEVPQHWWEFVRVSIMEDVIRDLELAFTRLLATNKEMYVEVDRFNSEAEFRLAIVPPLLVLAILFAAGFSLWALLALPLCVFLLAQAITSRREAGDMLADILLLRIVKVPRLESLERDVNDAIQGLPRPKLHFRDIDLEDGSLPEETQTNS